VTAPTPVEMLAPPSAPIHPARFFHPSNLVTYLSLLAGLAAVVVAHESRSTAFTGALIALSVLADTFDGRFARLFRRDAAERRFGEQLDSLTDAITFGFVPVIALYMLLPTMSGAALLGWWLAGFFYVASAITRLGFYNIIHKDVPGFIGLPTPVSALVWSSLLLAPPSAMITGVALVGCGVLMVSPLPIPRPKRIGLAAFAAWALLLIVLHGSASAGR